MTQIELMADYLTRNAEILKVTLADFSDQEMLVRPVPGANHTAWQLGHLVGSAYFMVSSVAPGVLPEAAGRIGEKCNGKTTNIDDPSFFPSKAELIEVFSQTQSAFVNWLKTLTPADLDKPTTDRLANFAPTVGLLALMMATHNMMHVGQIQVIRRKLGKPLLF